MRLLWAVLLCCLPCWRQSYPPLYMPEHPSSAISSSLRAPIARPFWQRWYLDVLLLGVRGYGFYLFNQTANADLPDGIDDRSA